MSASLVGSEMCIRDSCGTAGGVTAALACSAARRSRQILSKAFILASPRPVSYTHLTLPTICSV
eukprot:5715942-Alexandrium_andersonii.AAC.1